MKSLALTLILLILVNCSFAQEIGDSSIVEFPDKEATFPGGSQALMKFINENIKYPDSYFDIDVAGTIYLMFVVNKDGSISDIKIERGIDPQMDQMATNLVNTMPNWIPAELEGQIVRSYVRLPIRIHLY